MPPTDPMQQILLVDDSAVQRQLMRAICGELSNLQIFEAADGRQALNLIYKLGNIDLVVVDLNMPGMDGIELLQHLAKHAQIPAVILISGYAPELLENCGRAAKALGIALIAYLVKPIKPEELQRLVTELLLASKLETHHQVSDAEVPLIEMVGGLAQNQFTAYFQPIFSLKTGAIVQCEALARWVHPQRGLLAPGTFIDRLDQEGYLTLLTRRVAQASFDMMQRAKFSSEMRLSINLSRNQLEDAELLDWIHSQLLMRHLSPQQVVLEITENSAFANLGHTMTTLLRLRLRGFGLAIDDFGVGHTTMDMIKDLPMTELKFDMSLIKNIHREPRCQSIIDGMVRIAQELNLRMVAEGIDNLDDLNYLRQRYAGFDLHLQGFLFSKPVPADQLVLQMQQAPGLPS